VTTPEQDLETQVRTLKANIHDRDRVLHRLSAENKELKKEVERLTKLLAKKPKSKPKPKPKSKPATRKPTSRKKK